MAKDADVVHNASEAGAGDGVVLEKTSQTEGGGDEEQIVEDVSPVDVRKELLLPPAVALDGWGVEGQIAAAVVLICWFVIVCVARTGRIAVNMCRNVIETLQMMKRPPRLVHPEGIGGAHPEILRRRRSGRSGGRR